MLRSLSGAGITTQLVTGARQETSVTPGRTAGCGVPAAVEDTRLEPASSGGLTATKVSAAHPQHY